MSSVPSVSSFSFSKPVKLSEAVCGVARNGCELLFNGELRKCGNQPGVGAQVISSADANIATNEEVYKVAGNAFSQQSPESTQSELSLRLAILERKVEDLRAKIQALGENQTDPKVGDEAIKVDEVIKQAFGDGEVRLEQVKALSPDQKADKVTYDEVTTQKISVDNEEAEGPSSIDHGPDEEVHIAQGTQEKESVWFSETVKKVLELVKSIFHVLGIVLTIEPYKTISNCVYIVIDVTINLIKFMYQEEDTGQEAPVG